MSIIGEWPEGGKIIITRKRGLVGKTKSGSFNKENGAELHVASKRNWLRVAKTSRERPQKKYLIPSPKVSYMLNLVYPAGIVLPYAWFYLRPFLTMLLQNSVQISALPSETTLPGTSHPLRGCRVSFPSCTRALFHPFHLDALSVLPSARGHHHLLWGHGGPALLRARGWRGGWAQLQHWGWIWVFSLSRRQRSTPSSAAVAGNSSYSLIETIWLASVSCKTTWGACWWIGIACR